MSSTTRTLLPSAAPSTLKRKAMSITQTYYLAHSARGKLSSEAARADHNLRLLVGHANLLDSLMIELADAEQEQESWFNQSLSQQSDSVPSTLSANKHIQWADAIIEEPEEDWRSEDAEDSSDSASDTSESDIEMDDAIISRNRRVIFTVSESIPEEDEDEEEFSDDGEEDYAMLTLTRTPSHSPPELLHDSDDSDDEDSESSMPPSPPNDALPSFSEKQREQIATTGFYHEAPASIIPSNSNKQQQKQHQQNFFDQGFFLPQARPLVSAVSVY